MAEVAAKKEKPRTALVISGGGSKGAFAVGAVDYLMHVKKIKFDILCGTSTGALISGLIASNKSEMLRSLYTSVYTKDIITKRFLPAALLFFDSLYSTKPLEALIKKNITGQDGPTIFNSEIQMFLTTMSLQSGKTVYFQTGPESKKSSKYGVYHLNDYKKLLDALLASSSQPVLMSPVSIDTGVYTDQYVDGGVKDVAPLRVAIDNGATEIYTILLNPADFPREEKKFDHIMPIAGRTLFAMCQEIMENDINICQETNDKIDKYSILGSNILDNPYAVKKKINLHIIRPAKPIDGGDHGLRFDPKEMKVMVESGYKTAEKMFP